jgi:hypothetical protein
VLRKALAGALFEEDAGDHAEGDRVEPDLEPVRAPMRRSAAIEGGASMAST